ncbi:Ribosomal RNA small subunit methyltransferase I [Coccomyxa sp. Obi]|nr:Ribosomal RNA small subunit methyltransferase I [Coccomyxa sp. Obi]
MILAGNSCVCNRAASFWIIRARKFSRHLQEASSRAVLLHKAPRAAPQASQLQHCSLQASFASSSTSPLLPRGCTANASTSAAGASVPDTAEAQEPQNGTRSSWRGTNVLGAIRQPGTLDPGLYVVATPIGNLEDVTLRALRVLRDADCILAEDTRHSHKLMSFFGITTQLYSFHEHNEHAKEGQVLERLARGGAVALISDAGMPAVSDPGAKLIAAAVAARHSVVPVPGPSAVLASLVASGLPTDAFQFVGFLPAKTSQRQKRLQQLTGVQATLILYAPPHSVAAILDDMAAVLGGARRCVIAREMTKLHEEFHRGSVAELAAEMHSGSCKGEVTIVVEGASGEGGLPPSEEQIEEQLRDLICDGVPASHAAKLAAKSLGLPRSAVYEAAVRIAAETGTS